MPAFTFKKNPSLFILFLVLVGGGVFLLTHSTGPNHRTSEESLTSTPKLEAGLVSPDSLPEEMAAAATQKEQTHPVDCAHCAAKGSGTMSADSESGSPVLKTQPEFDPIFKRVNRDKVTFSRSDFNFLAASEVGEKVNFNLAGRQFSGEVALVREGEITKAYIVRFPEGVLNVTVDRLKEFQGQFLFQGDSRVVEIAKSLNTSDRAGNAQKKRMLLATEATVGDVLCAPPGAVFPLNGPQPNLNSGMLEESVQDYSQPTEPVAAIPLTYESDSGHVLYLNFDGETVTGDAWNSISGISTIEALPAPRTNDDEYVRNIWERVVEDFAPFNITVTTDRAIYDATPSAQRLQAIITPTSDVAPFSGGVAFLNSYATNFSDIVWVFNLDEYACATTVSHEAGHAFGLSHDGSGSVEYYPGHNGSYTPGWGAIMGAPFIGLNEEVDQWSKGEYADANNQEDDIAIIANAANGFGFKQDDFADSYSSGAGLDVGVLNTTGRDQVGGAGIISKSTDQDVFRFAAAFEGEVSMTVSPIDVESADAKSNGANLAVATRLLDDSGNEIAVGVESGDVLLASKVVASVAPGVYYLEVDGAGRGDDPSGGFSDYASLGQYEIVGDLPTQPLSITGSPPSGKLDKTVVLGDDSTSLANGTDFGYSYPSNNSIIHTFLLKNHGLSDLENVTANLANGIDFEIVSPPDATIPAGTSVLMSIAYDPLENGVNGIDDDTVTINYDTPDPLAFKFAIGGTSVQSATKDNYEDNNHWKEPTDLNAYEDVWLSEYQGEAFILSHPVDFPFDFYTINAANGSLITVEVSYNAEEVPITFELINSQNAVLGTTSSSEGRIRFLVPDDYAAMMKPFFIRVTSSDDTVLNPYDLRWSSTAPSGDDDFYEENDSRGTAFDLTGAFSPRLSEFLGKGILNDEDWYKLEVPLDPHIRILYVRADFVHAEGDINIEIFPENAGATEFFYGLSGEDEDYEVLTYFQEVSTADFAEEFTPDGNGNIMGVEPGTYYIRVSGDFAGNEYDLVVETKDDDNYEIIDEFNEIENDSEANAFDLGDGFVGKWLSDVDGIGLSADYGLNSTQENFVNLVDFDWFVFTVPPDAVIGEIMVDYDSIIDETRYFRLYDADLNLLGDSFSDEGDQEISEEGFNFFSVANPVGRTFYMSVVPESEISGLAPYDFRIRINETPPEIQDPVDDNYEENDRFNQLHDLTDNAGLWLSAKDGYGVNLDPDWYEIGVPQGASQLSIESVFDGNQGELGLTLYRKNGSQFYDIATAPWPPPGPEPEPEDPDAEDPEPEVVNSKSIVWDNPDPGTYAIYIDGDGRGNRYNLFWDYILGEDAYEENDSRAAAKDLTGHEKQLLSKLDGPGVQADEDWYRIEARADTEELRIIATFSDAEGDIDLELYNAAGYLINRSVSTSDNEAITLTNPAVGDYYVRLYFGNDANEYDLWWGAFSGDELDAIESDAYEVDNSSGVATTLPAFTSLQDLEGLATQTDPDWWSVELPAKNSGFLVDCSFTHADGDIDIEVFAPDSSVIARSDSQTDNEMIDYNASLPGGTYFIRVYGANLGNTYDLFRVANRDDSFEENDSRETASDIEAFKQLRLSTEDTPTQGDDDWYRVVAEEADSILVLEINYADAEGSIYYELYDSNGNKLASDITGDELKYLQYALPSTGDFFIRVFGDDAYNEYDLFWNAQPEDAFEENDIREEAYDISAEEGVDLEGVVFDDDWFVLDPPAGVVGVELTLDFVHAFGDTDVNVYNQFGELIEVAFSVTDGESLSFEVNPFEGVTYIEVFGYDGNLGNPYTLNWVSFTRDGYEDNDTMGTATDLTDFEGIPLSESSGGFGTSGDEDWYAIQPGNTNLNVYTRFIHADGDIDIELWDQNGDFVERATSDTDDELITTTVTPGATYYIRVFGETAGNPYDLVWNSYDTDDAFEENDEFADAFDIIAAEYEFRENLVQLDDDWYLIEVNPGEDLLVADIFPDSRIDNMVMELYDAGEELIDSVATADGENRIEASSLPEGLYYLRVSGRDLGGRYTIAWGSTSEDSYEENDTDETAYELSPVAAGDLSSIDGDGRQFDEDWYSLTLPSERSTISVNFSSFLDPDGLMLLTLYDGEGTLLESKVASGGSAGISVDDVDAGTYYIQVDGPDLGTPYDLTWKTFADDNYEDNDSLSQSFDLGSSASGSLSPIDGLGVRGADDDFYSLAVPEGYVTLDVTCIFAHNAGDGDIALELFDEGGTSLAASDTSTDDEEVSISVNPNGETIYILVSGAENNGATYDLNWSFGLEDLYEDNDTDGTASDITSLEGSLLSESMGYGTQSDSDFYRVTLPVDSIALNVDVIFAHSLGNIDVNVYDPSVALIGSATSTTDNETLSVPVSSAGGDYYIEVTGANSGNYYDLIWSVEVDDPYEENDSAGAPYDLSASEDSPLSAGLGLGKQYDEDWFSITTPPGDISLKVVIDGFEDLEGNLDLQIYDASGDSLGLADDGVNSEELSVPIDPAGETVKVRVFGEDKGNAYDLVWSTSTTDLYEENDFVEDFYDLSGSEGKWLSEVNGVATQSDDDWYQIVVSTGATTLTIDCTFTHADGDIDMELYRLDPTAEEEKTDPSLDQRKPTLVDRAISTDPNEQIVFGNTDAGFAPGIYFIRVYFGNQGNTYDLRWDDALVDLAGDSVFLSEIWVFGKDSNSLLDPRLLTPLANEDGDAFPNWAEFAFDLDVGVADTVVVDNAKKEINGKTYFTISFVRNTEAVTRGYNFYVEESSNLSFDGSQAVFQSSEYLGDGLERVTYRCSNDMSESPNCFFRIRVEPPSASGAKGY